MNKEQRTKLLQQLAHSSMGEALKDYFQELIDKMVDARTYDTLDFDGEGRASVKASAILDRIIKTLNLPKPEKKDHKEYE